MPYDNEYNRMIAREIDYMNRKNVIHCTETGQGAIDYRAQMTGGCDSCNRNIGAGAGSRVFFDSVGSGGNGECDEPYVGGTILGIQTGTVLGGPKTAKTDRRILSSFSSLGAPVAFRPDISTNPNARGVDAPPPAPPAAPGEPAPGTMPPPSVGSGGAILGYNQRPYKYVNPNFYAQPVKDTKGKEVTFSSLGRPAFPGIGKRFNAGLNQYVRDLGSDGKFDNGRGHSAIGAGRYQEDSSSDESSEGGLLSRENRHTVMAMNKARSYLDGGFCSVGSGGIEPQPKESSQSYYEEAMYNDALSKQAQPKQAQPKQAQPKQAEPKEKRREQDEDENNRRRREEEDYYRSKQAQPKQSKSKQSKQSKQSKSKGRGVFSGMFSKSKGSGVFSGMFSKSKYAMEPEVGKGGKKASRPSGNKGNTGPKGNRQKTKDTNAQNKQKSQENQAKRNKQAEAKEKGAKTKRDDTSSKRGKESREGKSNKSKEAQSKKAKESETRKQEQASKNQKSKEATAKSKTERQGKISKNKEDRSAKSKQGKEQRQSENKAKNEASKQKTKEEADAKTKASKEKASKELEASKNKTKEGQATKAPAKTAPAKGGPPAKAAPPKNQSGPTWLTTANKAIDLGLAVVNVIAGFNMFSEDPFGDFQNMYGDEFCSDLPPGSDIEDVIQCLRDQGMDDDEIQKLLSLSQGAIGEQPGKEVSQSLKVKTEERKNGNKNKNTQCMDAMNAVGDAREAIQAEEKPVRKSVSYFGSGEGSTFVTAVRNTRGEQTGIKERAQMNSRVGYGKQSRSQIVKSIMKEKGLSLIEASKYVKANGLY